VVRSGTFQKGRSGNPAVKVKGTRHRTTVAIGALPAGEASFTKPEEMSEPQRAYFASSTLHQLATNYDQIIRGGHAPWQ